MHQLEADDSRITPRMADFLSSIKYKPPPEGIRSELTGQKVFEHAANLPFQNFEQKTALRFRHVHRGDWIFELARYDSFTGTILSASGKTQWGATFWNLEWDNILGANIGLKVGQAADWNPWFNNFFPENADFGNRGKHTGFQDFLQDVEYITKMLDEMRGLEK